MCTSPRLLPAAVALALALVMVPGCLSKKSNLRDAERMSHSWLGELTKLTAPAPEVGKHKEKGESEEEPAEEEVDAADPDKALRDCFVDDGWDPQGFKNPTEAITWLRREPLTLGKVTSISLVEGGKGAEVVFELRSPTTVYPVTAHIITEQELPKCVLLRVDAKKP